MQHCLNPKRYPIMQANPCPHATFKGLTAPEKTAGGISAEKGDQPAIPDHVPEKFRAVWASLPGCCRSFYTNPGKGCCAGMGEPNPGIMSTTKPLEVTKSNNATPSAANKAVATINNPTNKGWVWATKDWSGYVIKGFLADMKRVMTGQKTD
jgi:hypothetical protein